MDFDPDDDDTGTFELFVILAAIAASTIFACACILWAPVES